MDLATHFRAIWSKRLVVLGTALVAALVVMGWRFTQPTAFEAETRLEVTAVDGGQGNRPTGDDAVFIAEGYAERARTRPVMAAAGAASGLGLDASAVEDRVTVATDDTTGTIEITATGPSAADAAALSDALAGALVADVAAEQRRVAEAALAPLRAEIDELAATLATLPADDPTRASLQARHDALVAAALQQELKPADRLGVVSPADPTSDPVGPRPIRDALLAFLVALVVAAELAVAAAALRDRFSPTDVREDVAAATGLPVLATVRRASEAGRREAVRELRTNLALMTPAFDAPSSVAVLGAEAGVGCTQTAIDLARAAAHGSHPVLLVDGDMRLPAIHERLGVPVGPGLSDVLCGAELEPHEVPTGGGHLFVLPAGDPLDDPVMALGEHLRDRVLAPASEQAVLTIIDTPPIAALADAAVIAAHCDTTLLVIDARTTSRRTVGDVLARLRHVGVIPLGIVVTGSQARTSRPGARARRPVDGSPQASPPAPPVPPSASSSSLPSPLALVPGGNDATGSPATSRR